MNDIFVFGIIFIYLCNWVSIHAFFQGLIQTRRSKRVVDEHIISFIREKTGVPLGYVVYLESKHTNAFMVGIPGFPQLVITNKLKKLLNREELEFVLLHELGHYVHFDTIRYFFLQLLLFFIGFILAYTFYFGSYSFIYDVIVAFVLASIYMQFVKKYERQADLYAISKLENITAMSGALRKLSKELSFPQSNLLYRSFLDGHEDTVKRVLAAESQIEKHQSRKSRRRTK